ncbi:DNA-binding protein HU-beta [bacterium BMS3Abin07]|nr:DNA-binding protein HU-beta [bacterium BMS3Abin07]GBE32962.1 DNA-binding protein HU-beta [bacterium BMS3Bbin05]HDL20615.1 HU family DNA-binding protein [Nitrospirota bacterium]
MNKGDLIEKVSSLAGSSKAEAGRSVNAVLDTISKALKKGDSVTLVGFGTFSVAKTKARKGRNPQTGETIKIKAGKRPRFKAGQGLKNMVAGKKK